MTWTVAQVTVHDMTSAGIDTFVLQKLRAAAALGARLMTLDGVGHSPNIEVPETVAALLGELWLD